MHAVPVPSGLRPFLALATVALLASCGVVERAGTSEPVRVQVEERSGEMSACLIASLRGRNAVFDAYWYAETLADYLPSQLVKLPGAPPRRAGAGVVVGEVTAVDPGFAYTVDGQDAASGRKIAFESPEALWRHVVVTLEVHEGWGESAGVETIQFGFPVSLEQAETDCVIAGLRTSPPLVVALDEPDLYTDSGPDVYSVSRSSVALGVVDDGQVEFPGFGRDATAFIDKLTTVEAIRAASEEPQPVIVVEDPYFEE